MWHSAIMLKRGFHAYARRPMHIESGRHSHAERRMMKFGNFLQQTNFPPEQVNQL